MDKTAFRPDTRYTLTWCDPDDRLRPAKLYVYRVYETFKIARLTQDEGSLLKIPYENLIRIVREEAVAPGRRYFIPAAVLDEASWLDRTAMDHYSGAPGLGK